MWDDSKYDMGWFELYNNKINSKQSQSLFWDQFENRNKKLGHTLNLNVLIFLSYPGWSDNL